MFGQGYDLTFHSKGRVIKNEQTTKPLVKENKTSWNMYILDGVKGEKCCMLKWMRVGDVIEGWVT